jgi:hypothetical protein
MGIKRGAFESVGLTQTADSAKNPNIQIDSVARGMRAFGAGLGAVADLCGKLANMADKAYAAKSGNFQSFGKSLEALAQGEAKFKETQEAFKGRENTPDGKAALKLAEDNVKMLQNSSDLALDKWARSGMLFPKIGTATVKSGEQRRLEATDKNGNMSLTDVEQQSVIGAMFFKNW